MSEQANAVFEVRKHPSVKDDVGYHLQVTGVVDPAAKTISVAIPKKTATKK